MPGTHKCPKRGCAVVVPNARYACLPHWRELSSGTQQAIRATARRHVLHPDRRAAFRSADEDWGQA